MLGEDDRDILDAYISAHDEALEDYSIVYKEMVEESTKNFVEKTKQELEENITDINNTISDLENN